MKKTIFLFHRTTTLAALVALVTTLSFAQGPAPQRPPSKGAVIKGKAPVNKEILKVKLPKPYETKLRNGLQVLILEDHKLPTFNMQMIILSGGLSDPEDQIGAAQDTQQQTDCRAD
jgi:hypothetical protein